MILYVVTPAKAGVQSICGSCPGFHRGDVVGRLLDTGFRRYDDFWVLEKGA